MTGVGSLVLVAGFFLGTGLPGKWLSAAESFGPLQVGQLGLISGLFMVWLIPLDFLGGFWLPRKYHKSRQGFREWLWSYVPAALVQATLFVLFGSLILLLSQQWGRLGGGVSVSLLTVALVIIRNRLQLNRQVDSPACTEKLVDAIAMIRSWEIFVPRVVVVDHKDAGFTGGIIGLPARANILIPGGWLSFSTEQLAVAIARRALAVDSGSYARGLALAFAWNLGGFLLCSILPGGGLATVAGLATTLCGFTLWSFLGLLLLPTVSRNASLKIDQSLVERGMPFRLISETASSMDRLQDNEPVRPGLVETIFHPVPSVAGRNRRQPVRGIAAWNVARTALFFSWACLGFLSRSVHCNVGRPELWTMLPTD